MRGRWTRSRIPLKQLTLTECYRVLPLGNTMMPDGGAAHRLPHFEQRRSREFKFRTKNQFPNIRKPDKNAHLRVQY